MRKILLITALLVIALTPMTALADTYCINDSWSRTAMAVDGTSKLIDDYCQFNCSTTTQRCNPGFASPIEAIMLIVGIVSVSGLLIFLGTKLKEGHWGIQYLLVFMALFLLLTGVHLTASMHSLTWSQIGDTMALVYSALIYTVLIFLLYFLVQMIIKAANHLKKPGAGVK